MKNAPPEFKARLEAMPPMRKSIMLANRLVREPRGIDRIKEAEWTALTSLLSETAQESLKNSADRQRTLSQWLRVAMYPQLQMRPRPPTTDQLLAFYREHVTATQRKKLESLSVEKSKQELLQMYWEHYRGQTRSRSGFQIQSTTVQPAAVAPLRKALGTSKSPRGDRAKPKSLTDRDVNPNRKKGKLKDSD